MQMKMQRHSQKRRGESSDGRMFIGNWEYVESEMYKQRLGDKVAGDGYLGLDESMDKTTVNEQGVQWDFTDVEMKNEAFRKIVAEKPFLLMEHIRVPVGGRNRTRAGVA